MKKTINWKQFAILLLFCVIATLFVLPYTLALSPTLAQVLTPVVLTLQVIQATIIFSLSLFLGMLLQKKIGWDKPIAIKPYLRQSILIGALCGVFIILFSFLFSSLSVTFLQAEASVALWKRFLASFYGGYAEEIVFRLFVMTLFVWLSTKLIKTKDNKPTNTGIWIAIILSTLLFGLGHLGITGSMVAITPIVILRAILLNGVGGVFGWLYWKKGLGAAMVAHFSADIVIHVITPTVALLFL